MVNTREIAAEYRMAHWAGIMQERQESGLSITTYCKKIGIDENVYYYWQRKLREAACQNILPAAEGESPKAIIPNGWVVCESARSEPSFNNGESGVLIEIGKSRIRAGANVDTELLAKICRVLIEIC